MRSTGASPGRASSSLCDPGQVTEPLWAFTYPPPLHEHMEMNHLIGPPSFTILRSMAENPYRAGGELCVPPPRSGKKRVEGTQVLPYTAPQPPEPQPVSKPAGPPHEEGRQP